MEKRQVLYYTKHIRQEIGNISARYFLPPEFPFIDRGGDPSSELHKAMAVQPESVQHYALALSGRQLENLLLSLRENVSESEADRICLIFKKRMNKRLLGLLWILFQFIDESYAIFKVFSEFAGFSESTLYELTDSSKEHIPFESTEHMLAKAVESIEGADGSLEEIYKHLGLIETSDFSKKVTRKFFSVCKKQAFADNFDFLTHFIIESGEFPKDNLENYLLKLEVDEYSETVNNYITAYYGAVESELWQDVSPSAFEKYILWYRKTFIIEHTEPGSPRQKLLLSYLDYIKSVDYDAENALFAVGFKDFYIIHFSGSEIISYYIEKGLFEQIRKEKDVRMLIEKAEKKTLIEAKDYILWFLDSNIVELHFFEVDTLYIFKFLDIKLNITVDIRAVRENTKKFGFRKIELPEDL